MGFLMCSSPLKAAGQAEGRLTPSSPFSIPFALLSLYLTLSATASRSVLTFFLFPQLSERMSE